MDNLKVKYCLVLIWLLGLFFCLTIVLLSFKALPDLFGKSINQVVDTFSPQLAIMLAFIFSEQFQQERKRRINSFAAILAIVISLVYVLVFCSIIFAFYLDRFDLTMEDVHKLFDDIRPKTSFLVSGTIAFYFASREELPAPKANP